MNRAARRDIALSRCSVAGSPFQCSATIAMLQRLQAVSRRAARFIPGWIKRKLFGPPL